LFDNCYHLYYKSLNSHGGTETRKEKVRVHKERKRQ